MSRWVFGLLRALFPRAFRDAFGSEMREVFAAQLRDARARGTRSVVALWARTIAGMLSAAWDERRDSRRPGARIGPILRWDDLRHAVRRLASARGFTFTAVATLALCLSANLTIFAVVH